MKKLFLFIFSSTCLYTMNVNSDQTISGPIVFRGTSILDSDGKVNLQSTDGTHYTLGGSLYPVYATGTTTTYNSTNGSPDIIVASATGLVIGDVISSASVFSPSAGNSVQIINIVGTTVTLDHNATATQSGASITFGTDRFDAGDTTFTNTLGARNGYFGAAAKGHSTWVAKYYGGADFSSLTPFFSIAPGGNLGGLFATRSSDNASAGGATIGLGVETLADNASVNHSSWGIYSQGDLLPASDGVGAQHFGYENVIVNGWTASADSDPYTPNPVRSTFNLRLGSGFGGRVANRVTAAIDIITEGGTGTANYGSGIIFGSDALDIAAGRIAPAIAMAPSQALTWYRAAGTRAWDIYSTATTGSNSLVLKPTTAYLSSSLSFNDSSFVSFAGDVVPGTTNYAMFGGVAQTVINGPTASGFVDLRINNVSKLLLNSSGNLTAAGTYTAPLGSSSATSIQPTGNAATGIYFPNANQVQIAGNGLAGLLVNGSGNLIFNGSGKFIGFGGLAVTGPMLTYSGTSLKLRLGDDSADAPFTSGAITASGVIATTDTTVSTSSTTGALKIAGGVGIAGRLNVGGTINQFGDASGTPAHITTAQLTPPALTSCGTGSPVLNGTDTAGTVVMGTSATGCVITFNVAYASTPYCVVTWRATPLASQSYTLSTTAITTTQTSTSGNILDYICIGRVNG